MNTTKSGCQAVKKVISLLINAFASFQYPEGEIYSLKKLSTLSRNKTIN